MVVCVMCMSVCMCAVAISAISSCTILSTYIVVILWGLLCNSQNSLTILSLLLSCINMHACQHSDEFDTKYKRSNSRKMIRMKMQCSQCISLSLSLSLSCSHSLSLSVSACVRILDIFYNNTHCERSALKSFTEHISGN